MIFALVSVLLVTIAAGEMYGVSLTPSVFAIAWIFGAIYALRLVLRGAWQLWSSQRLTPAASLVRIADDVPRSIKCEYYR